MGWWDDILSKILPTFQSRSDNQRPTVEIGEIYSFKTKPFSEYAPSDTDRYAAIKVIGKNSSLVAVAVLDGIWSSKPGTEDVSGAGILREHRFLHNGSAACFGVQNFQWTPSQILSEFDLVCKLPLSKEERHEADQIIGFKVGCSFASLNHANLGAEGEWRWANDREKFEREYEAKQLSQDTERKAAEERYRTRLKTLTWEKFLNEPLLKNWSTSPPFPSAELTAQVRDKIIEASKALQELGEKPRKAEVRQILRETVLWLNEFDRQANGVIETDEREDLCLLLEEMAYLSKQKSLIDEIDGWREW